MAEATTIGDVLDSAKDFGPEAQEWFQTGWYYLSNGMFTELTLGQAGFTVFSAIIAVLWLLDHLEGR